MSCALAFVDDAAAVAAELLFEGAGLAATEAVVNTDGGWSVAFIQYVGRWSHFDPRVNSSVWPLPATSSCSELAAFAASNFVLAADAPRSGDIYLLWSPRKGMFVRAGIVLGRVRPSGYPSGKKAFRCLTIDGDTTPYGSLRGPYAAVVQRVISPAAGDRLIRWPLLELLSGEQLSDGEQYRRAA